MTRLAAKITLCMLAAFVVVTRAGQPPAAPNAPAQADAAPAHPKAASDPALLHPASLNAKAPDVFNVRFTTTKGDFVVQVTRAWAPQGADRFYNLVKHGFFTDAAFFRVVPGFVVQFGLGPDPAVNKAWQNANIKDDPVTQSNLKGTITFAQTQIPNSRSTQLFINVNDNPGLDHSGQGFMPFGKVTSGMDVIASFYSGYGDRPTGDQDNIAKGGKAYLEKTYPKLDSIKTATIVSP
jgi:peptidyl-prolyl cis-trans isomerase A (cyclophilin A)